ncbi:MAG: PmoA family protein [Pirellulales bacterium]|nr:PmoA family protein [Pirellulales bacterium]
MPCSLPRRDFLRLSLAAAAPAGALWAASPAGTQPRPVPGAEKLTAYQVEPGNPHIWVRWGNRLLTSYRAHQSQKYPYMYPVTGPISGLSLTTETSLPYPHHRSLLFACDRVNGGNYWQDNLAAGQILSRGPRLGEVTPESAEILDRCVWKQPDGPVICRDERKITVAVSGPRLRLIDWQLKWVAVEEVTVTRTNHSLFSIRAAGDITPWGGGALVNSEGLSGEQATFGKPAAWCGYHGKRQNVPGNVVEGIAILDHPENPWSPCPWFTRDYGFISPTPMNFLEKPWRLPAGESVTLRYRVVLHASDPKDAGLDGIYKSWIAAT